MARMIPSNIAQDCRSPGEPMLFARFRDDPDTSNWIVLHSFGIAKHPTRLAGEADFVIIVPSEGILVLEVKGGNVARRDGEWVYGSGASAERSPIGPFRQASDVMHAIRKDLGKRVPDLRGLLFQSGVIFTYTDFDEESPEWHRWQFANRGDVARQPVSAICLRMLRRAHDHVRSTPSAKWYDNQRSRPSRDQASRVAEALRRDFEFAVSPAALAAEGERRIERFTQEQFDALDLLEDNHRVVFKGPAGTGKTFLALEAAYRGITQGRKVLLACYNRLLGDWLEREARRRLGSAPYPGHGSFGTFHSTLLRLSGLSVEGREPPDFWTRTLPESVIERALRGEIEAPVFDEVLLDEAQDLATDAYLDVIELLLEGGLAGGRWAFFGDFERQAIYGGSPVDAGERLLGRIRARSPQHTVCTLRTNCRNSEQIAIGIELACRLQPAYTGVLSTQTGPELSIHFYGNPGQQAEQLENSIRGALRRFTPHQLIVLSTKEDGSSCAGVLSKGSPHISPPLRPLRNDTAGQDAVRFATIHAFKGLESSAVILTDIEQFGGERMEALLYVGMSRARLHLTLLMHESCRSAYETALRQGFGNLKRVRGHGYA